MRSNFFLSNRQFFLKKLYFLQDPRLEVGERAVCRPGVAQAGGAEEESLKAAPGATADGRGGGGGGVATGEQKVILK